MRRLILILLVAILCHSVPVLAQLGCTDSCNAAISVAKKKQLQLANGCWVEVQYSTQGPCNGYYNLYILNFRLLTPSCSGGTMADILLAAQKTLVFQIQLPPGPLISFVRVIRPLCWQTIANNCSDTLYEPCSETGCCITDYSVFGGISTSRSVGFCDTLNNPHCDSICGEPDSNWIYHSHNMYNMRDDKTELFNHGKKNIELCNYQSHRSAFIKKETIFEDSENQNLWCQKEYGLYNKIHTPLYRKNTISNKIIA